MLIHNCGDKDAFLSSYMNYVMTLDVIDSMSEPHGNVSCVKSFESCGETLNWVSA